MMLEQAKEAFEEGEEYILLFIRERGNRWVTKKKMLRCFHYQQLIEERRNWWKHIFMKEKMMMNPRSRNEEIHWSAKNGPDKWHQQGKTGPDA